MKTLVQTTMNNSRSRQLLSPYDLRGLPLRNRVVMAPLTRARAGRERLPNDLMAEYCAQRASAGLIITEATVITEQGFGWELNPPADMKVWSAPTAQGYTDFPFHPSTSRL
jgi:2,4-dienoyl-CoA reductase-like NADH-dependent reductase (Old Yellow Enzyme family)